MGNFEGEKGPTQNVPNITDSQYTNILKATRQWGRGGAEIVLCRLGGSRCEVHNGATRQNCLRVATMRPYVKLLLTSCYTVGGDCIL